MLKEAKKNTGVFAEKITWKLSDAQKLELGDCEFDAVFSRNVTWNLENPGQAYEEWVRVLKPGGLLCNFDADWYGHLYDEEKRSGYEKDRQRVEEKNLEDYYTGTDIERMEAIARQVPLSRQKRPQWDVEALKNAGLTEVSCDTEVWKQVWTEEEIANNGSTPIFLLSGKKEKAFASIIFQWNPETCGQVIWSWDRANSGFRLPCFMEQDLENNADHCRSPRGRICGDTGCY